MRLFVVAFAFGTLALQQQAELPEPRLGMLGVALLLAVGLLTRQRRIARGILIACAGLLIGFGLAAWRAELRLADQLPHEREGQDIALTGVVASLPQRSEKGVRFLFHREAGDAAPRVLALAWYPDRNAGGASTPSPHIEAGQRWALTVRLKRPRGLSNPHAFDFEPWALERGIRATGYVRAREPPRLLEARVEGWPYTLHRWRGEIRQAMQAQLAGGRMQGVLVALAIGDQDSIPASDWDIFWRTGVGHLMSISGLHITMLAALAYGVVAWAWVRVPPLALRIPARKVALLAGVVVALAYSLLAGYQVPAQRTLCMLAVIALCVMVDRHGSPSRVLALAALVVLALDPWAVISAGFWLSFGAVAAIFYVMALRAGPRPRWDAALREQLAVTVAMLPMLVALFQQVSLVSPVANAFAIPLVSLVVVPLTLAGVLLPVPPFLDGAHGLMAFNARVLEVMAAWPHAMVETHAPEPWTVGVALVGCAWLLAPRGVPLRSCGMLWLLPMFLVGPARPAHGEAWLDVLDVGNGLAVVVRTASHALAYDTGPGWNAEADSGSRVVVPFLRGEGVARLSGLVVSHADDDHGGGAMTVAVSRQPSWLLSPLDPADPLHFMVERSVWCVAGLRWNWDGVEFEVLHPVNEENPLRRRKENDRSCVVRLATRGASALLTGDIEARSEGELLARDRAALASDVLLVPHHGSRSSSTAAFLDAVRPRQALVSVGHRNRYRHPQEAVLARYAERGVALYRTDRDGALRVELPAGSARPPVVKSHSSRVRYWSDRRPP